MRSAAWYVISGPRHWIYTKRQLYADLIKMRRANIAGRMKRAFNRVSKATASDLKLKQLDNGLIETSNGYYGLTQDQETGEVHVLWAREQEFLLNAFDPDKANKDEPDQYVYYVDPLGRKDRNLLVEDDDEYSRIPIDGSNVRSIIKNDFDLFTEQMERFALSGGNVSDLYETLRIHEAPEKGEDKLSRAQVYMFANEGVTYVVRDSDQGDWVLEKYAPYTRLNAAEAYVEITNPNINRDLLAQRVFKNGYEKERFKTQSDAFDALFKKEWTETVQEVWRGGRPVKISEAPYTVFRTFAYDYGARQLKNAENYIESFFDSGVESVPIIFTGARIVVPALSHTIATAVTVGFLMRQGLDVVKMGYKEADFLVRKAKAFHPEIANDIAQDRGNQRRARKKLHPDFIKRNKLLPLNNLTIGGVSEDDEPIYSAADRTFSYETDIPLTDDQKNNNDMVIARYFSTLPNKGLPVVNTLIDKHSMVHIFQNGIVQLVAKSPETGKKVTYSMYDKEYDTNPHISPPLYIREALEAEKIIKTHQRFSEADGGSHELDRTRPEEFYEEIQAIFSRSNVESKKPSNYKSMITFMCHMFRDSDQSTDIIPFPNISHVLAPK